MMINYELKISLVKRDKLGVELRIESTK